MIKFKLYKGRLEEDPGKMKYRHKGIFASGKRARDAQQRLSRAGKKARVIRMNDVEFPYRLEVMAQHDFWKNNFIVDRRE